jgi:hypothetical protein
MMMLLIEVLIFTQYNMLNLPINPIRKQGKSPIRLMKSPHIFHEKPSHKSLIFEQ